LIPFVDLKLQYRTIKPEIDAAVISVLESGTFTLGGEVAAFEEEFAAYHEVGSGIAVNSGTSALHLALLACGVSPGDEVLTVPFTFVATVAAIRYTGARPVFVDVDVTATMDPTRIEAALTPHTKAILPVHLHGHPADMDPILEIGRRRGIPVIEDACQAHGARYKGQRVGGLGDLGCFSFYPAKNLGAYGEGGMVVTNNSDHVRTLRMLRDWGQEKKYHHVLKGFNYRMEALQAAILRVKLRRLDTWNQSRRSHADQYDLLLSGSAVSTPRAAPWAEPAVHVYAVRSRQRDALQQRLDAAGIQTSIHYPIPVHLQPAHADLGHGHGDFPVSEALAAEVLSLPMFPELTPEQIDFVCATVNDHE
jgi:dTDP-4-amino-4,6-dideoxygalactose transaminase